MATLYPNLEMVRDLKVKPEEGELHLLEFLAGVLDDSYEVYFNPMLNGDRPDVIIMRKDHGILIIEVKDWNLSNFHIDNNKQWRMNSDNTVVKSPVEQVLKYKKNLYDLHIRELLELKIKNCNYWGLIYCALYFHNEPVEKLNKFILNPFNDDEKYSKFMEMNIDLIGKDNLSKGNLVNILKKRYIAGDRKSKLFTKDLYCSFKRHLGPPRHIVEEGEEINLSNEQAKLIVSMNREQRIKGVVGSGKTTVLAQRAVNAHNRTNEEVLILTFNITLKNYIHDKISKVRSEFEWENFYINNYHHFISMELNNLGIEIEIPPDFNNWDNNKRSNYFEENYYSNLELFKKRKDKIHKFKTILIDEIQDYKRKWMEIIKECFLKEHGEYVLFGDEKQNIYGNVLENRDCRTNVRQNPSTLTHCFRSNNRITLLAKIFQKKFYTSKYNIDDFENQGEIGFEDSGFIRCENISESVSVPKSYKLVLEVSKQLNEHPNDIAVISFTNKYLRKLDCYYRYMSRERTNTMFESQEIFVKLWLEENADCEFVKLGAELFLNTKSDLDELSLLAKGVTLNELSLEFNEDAFSDNLDEFLRKRKISKSDFEDWYSKNEVSKLLSNSQSRKFLNQVEKVRQNKKYNFWLNSGTIKFSTIHSFKGWEANTVFLILEAGFNDEEPGMSVEELVYTGITRSRKNLIILNQGNTEFHNKIEELITGI